MPLFQDVLSNYVTRIHDAFLPKSQSEINKRRGKCPIKLGVFLLLQARFGDAVVLLIHTHTHTHQCVCEVFLKILIFVPSLWILDFQGKNVINLDFFYKKLCVVSFLKIRKPTVPTVADTLKK